MRKQEAHERLATNLSGAGDGAGVDKATLLAAAQDAPNLYALIDRYIPDERYRDLDDALQLIPEEGWQDLQGG